jgi:sugar phosphate permease
MMATMGSLRNKALWLIVSCVGWGALTSAFGMAQTPWLVFVMIACVGWMSSWNMSLNRGMLQMQVDNRMRGRIMSIDMMSHGLMPLGVFPISWIAENYDVGTALVASGSAFVVLTLLSVLFIPAVKTTDDPRAQAVV